jgi:hypothetical protein
MPEIWGVHKIHVQNLACDIKHIRTFSIFSIFFAQTNLLMRNEPTFQNKQKFSIASVIINNGPCALDSPTETGVSSVQRLKFYSPVQIPAGPSALRRASAKVGPDRNLDSARPVCLPAGGPAADPRSDSDSGG